MPSLVAYFNNKMKIEFLDDIDGGGRYPGAYPKQLLRLYDFDCQ